MFFIDCNFANTSSDENINAVVADVVVCKNLLLFIDIYLIDFFQHIGYSLGKAAYAFV